MFAIWSGFTYDKPIMWPQSIEQTTKKLIQICQQKGIELVTVESCTGGLVAASITAIPGSSAIFERGYVTYSNAVKHKIVQVPENVFKTDGAVSDACVLKMAEGAYQKENEFVISLSGIAGPDGGSAEKPVGLVYFGLKSAKKHISTKQIFKGDRNSVREQATLFALNLLMEEISHEDV